MRNILKSAFLLCIIIAVASCAPPEPAGHEDTGLENQIRINGTVDSITWAGIAYLGSERYLFIDNGSGDEICLSFASTDSRQIPTGHWTSIDGSHLMEFEHRDYDQSTTMSFTSSTNTAVDILISGTDGASDGSGGVLTIDGTAQDGTEPAFDCAFNYSGPYEYYPE